MSDVLPRHYIIGIIMFTFFIVGGVSMLSMMSSDGAMFAGDAQLQQFNNTFNIQQDISSSVTDLETSVTGADLDPGPFGMLNALISSSWTSLRLLFSSFGFMNSVFVGLSTVFGIPSWIPALIVLIVTVVIVFAIFGAIFQRNL